MKTRIVLIMLSLVALFVPACLPPDDNVNPDDAITKFLGNWNVDESCRRLNYSVEIQADPGNTAQVLIYNFGNPGPGYDPAVGLVVTNSIMFLPRLSVKAGQSAVKELTRTAGHFVGLHFDRWFKPVHL